MKESLHIPAVGRFRRRLSIDGRSYRVRVHRRVAQPADAPRLVVVSLLPNESAREVLRVCIEAVRRYTPEPHEIWVIDNHSPREQIQWLLGCEDINLALNQTEPVPPEHRGIRQRLRGRPNQLRWASYANAVGLEIALRLIDPAARYVMTLHMDSAPCKEGWLSFLRSKIDEGAAAAGVRMDTARDPDGVLHILGCMFDFRRLTALGLDFLPDLPRHDVGDLVTVRLRQNGYGVFACPNSLHDPSLIEKLAIDSPFRSIHADRAFDDKGRVVFMHMGRAVRKSTGETTMGTPTEEWVRFFDDQLSAN